MFSNIIRIPTAPGKPGKYHWFSGHEMLQFRKISNSKMPGNWLKRHEIFLTTKMRTL